MEKNIRFIKSKYHKKKNLNILIIEDDESCLLAAEMCFKASPYNLIKAYSGKMGINYLLKNSNEVNLIILDLMMPDMDGFEVLNIIKNNQCIKHIPVIISTGSSRVENMKKAFVLGASFYLKKPYRKDALFDIINKIILK